MNAIVSVDLDDPRHVDDLLNLLDEYASGPAGNGAPLVPQARERLPALLRSTSSYRGWLAYSADQAAGLVNCFDGVSTFRAMPLMNVHDLIVGERFRRRGIGSALLAQVEHAARARGCCKITLEVLEGNAGALAAYRKAGFMPYQLDPRMGRAVFLEKHLH